MPYTFSKPHPYALTADEGSARMIGNIPGALQLGAAAIGECTINGDRVTITWGRNIPPAEQRWHFDHLHQMVSTGASDGSVELVLQGETADQLRSMMIPHETIDGPLTQGSDA